MFIDPLETSKQLSRSLVAAHNAATKYVVPVAVAGTLFLTARGSMAFVEKHNADAAITENDGKIQNLAKQDIKGGGGGN